MACAVIWRKFATFYLSTGCRPVDSYRVSFDPSKTSRLSSNKLNVQPTRPRHLRIRAIPSDFEEIYSFGILYSCRIFTFENLRADAPSKTLNPSCRCFLANSDRIDYEDLLHQQVFLLPHFHHEQTFYFYILRIYILICF